MEGVQAVVHLGGVAVEEAWEKIMPANVAGAYNVFEAARRQGVKRIIVASTSSALPIQVKCGVIRVPTQMQRFWRIRTSIRATGAQA